jgi:hypothetical protein
MARAIMKLSVIIISVPKKSNFPYKKVRLPLQELACKSQHWRIKRLNFSLGLNLSKAKSASRPFPPLKALTNSTCNRSFELIEIAHPFLKYHPIRYRQKGDKRCTLFAVLIYLFKITSDRLMVWVGKHLEKAADTQF